MSQSRFVIPGGSMSQGCRRGLRDSVCPCARTPGSSTGKGHHPQVWAGLRLRLEPGPGAHRGLLCDLGFLLWLADLSSLASEGMLHGLPKSKVRWSSASSCPGSKGREENSFEMGRGTSGQCNLIQQNPVIQTSPSWLALLPL